MMESTRILCTGGRGFIGRHLVRCLVRKGLDVWCLLGPGEQPDPCAEGDIHWIRGDITDPSTLGGIRGPFSTIYHLAGLCSSFDPARFYRVNYDGTKNVVAAVLAGGRPPKRLLFASSYAAMGPALGTASLCENSPCRPVSEYGRSKLMAENYLRSLNDVLPVTIVRLPLVYGPGSMGGLLPYFKLISKGFCPCLARGEATLGFVEDIVAAIVMATEAPGAQGKTILLGDGRATSLEEVLLCIEKAVGRRAVRVRIPKWAALKYAVIAEKVTKLCGGRPSTLRQVVEGFLQYPSWRADTSMAREELGISAQVSFEEGARITAAWYRQNGFI